MAGGPGGAAHWESRGAWGAARPPNNRKCRVTGQNRKPIKIFFLLGEILEPGICKLHGKFGNLARFLEPGQVLSERPDVLSVPSKTFYPKVDQHDGRQSLQRLS